MTLTELRYIAALAHERHFGRAAEACFVSQPTLSIAVKKLEEELGVILFERARHEVAITPVGRRIVERAHQVLHEMEAIKHIARQACDPCDGLLRIGAIYTIGPYLFPRLVPMLHQIAPRMPLIIEENYTSRLRERLIQGELDVILVCLPFEESGVVTQPLYDEPSVVMVHSGHPWVDQAAIAAEDLASQTVLLLGAGHCFRDQVVTACPRCVGPPSTGSGLQQTVEASSLETIRYMVASGLGITVLPCTAVAGYGAPSAPGTVIRPFTTPPQRRVVLAWRVSFPRPQAIDALRQAVQACALTCVTYLHGAHS